METNSYLLNQSSKSLTGHVFIKIKLSEISGNTVVPLVLNRFEDKPLSLRNGVANIFKLKKIYLFRNTPYTNVFVVILYV